MIDHISLRVTHFEASKKFYAEALKPLGYVVIMEFPEGAGLGADGKPDLWITQAATTTPTHIAFLAKSRKNVDEFYEAALKAGGKDNGKPGMRPIYHAGYYGAFILDPDGHNIEAVVHKPE